MTATKKNRRVSTGTAVSRAPGQAQNRKIQAAHYSPCIIASFKFKI
ncbi:MAG: hypothetical protein Q8O04_02185 [Deltaproteobacteria bacterium]|nr:hypothetical protein [Deltaproteobacteria bacterium]